MRILSLQLATITLGLVDVMMSFHFSQHGVCMKKSIACSFLSLFSLLSLPALAEATAVNASQQVAVIDMQGAILQTDEGKVAKAKLEKEVTQKRQDLSKQEAQLKKMQNDFQAQQAVLSEADKQARSKEFQTKLQAFQQSQLNFEQEARQKEATELQKIFVNLQTEINKLAKQKGYEMVFDKSAGVLLYAKNVVDVTTDVVTMYNKDYKAKDKK